MNNQVIHPEDQNYGLASLEATNFFLFLVLQNCDNTFYCGVLQLGDSTQKEAMRNILQGVLSKIVHKMNDLPNSFSEEQLHFEIELRKYLLLSSIYFFTSSFFKKIPQSKVAMRDFVQLLRKLGTTRTTGDVVVVV